VFLITLLALAYMLLDTLFSVLEIAGCRNCIATITRMLMKNRMRLYSTKPCPLRRRSRNRAINVSAAVIRFVVNAGIYSLPPFPMQALACLPYQNDLLELCPNHSNGQLRGREDMRQDRVRFNQ